MLCNKSWHLTGNPKLMWYIAHLIKEDGCVDLSMDTMNLKILKISMNLKALLLSSLPLHTYTTPQFEFVRLFPIFPIIDHTFIWACFELILP